MITDKEIKSYLNKPAKIAWLPQKDFLWFHNPYRQIAKLEIDGKVINVQKNVKHNVEDSPIGRGFVIFLDILLVASMIFLYIVCNLAIKMFLKENKSSS